MNLKIYKTLLLLPFLCLTTLTVFAQVDDDDDWFREESRFYWSSGMDMLFSWSSTTHPTSNDGVVVRWAPVVNIHGEMNYDFGQYFGVMGGFSVRNVGYIYHFNDVDGVEFRKKFRSYNFGIPVGIKIGNTSGFHVFGGYEIEFPFAYKEKTFNADGSKIDKFTSWFSDRVEPVQQGIFVGIQFRHGPKVTFKYYFTEIHNNSFAQTTPDDYPPSGDPLKPYDGLSSNIMYIAVGTSISKKNYTYYRPPSRRR